MPLGPAWTPAAGTYAVNPDCSGTAVVVTPNSPVPLHFHLVVSRDGKQVNTVLDTDAILAEFTKVHDWH